jgi:hypothetical protein
MKKDYAYLFIINQNNWLKILVMFLFFTGVNVSTYSQAAKPDKKEAEIKKLEMQLKTAKANLAKAEKAKAINDSLTETGTKMMDEGDEENKQLEADQKKADKEYATQTKALTKRMNSKDKDDAAQAKTEFKEIDIKYKADQKEFMTKKKALEKKAITGKMNMDKAKASRKTSEEALLRAQSSVEAIEQKIEALKSGDTATEESGKKSKKK